MSFEAVKNYFRSVGAEDHITVWKETGDTVEHAAKLIGCAPAEIAKAMSFMVDGKPIMVVMAGDAKVNSSKFKACFHIKPTMIPYDQVEILIGHAPGGVCPFAVNEGVNVFLDESLRRFSTIYTAAGTDTATICLTMDELIKFSNAAGLIDVCKGWLANEFGQAGEAS
ncbi:MAG: YbaK/EbsC family protein [Clostridiales bacterium]|nr:YbaK/EbsC family protein [Clostridiales bacterium]